MSNVIRSNYFRYISHVIDAYVDRHIFKQMYDFYKQFSDPNGFSEPNPSVFAENVITSSDSLVIYTSFAIESYTNLLGESLLPNKFFSKYLDRLPLLDKFSAIIEMKYNENPEFSSEPFQTLSRLKNDRDKLAHDKSRHVYSMEELNREMKKYTMRTNLRRIFQTLLAFDRYMSALKCDIVFLNDYHKGRIKSWLSRKKFYKVGDGLLFAPATFPSIIEYRFTVRRHTGFMPVGYQLDEERKLFTKNAKKK